MPRRGHTEIVRASKPAEGASTWKLTELDKANLFLVLRGTWLFDESLDPALLKYGLEQLLGFYPHLAGRMVQGREVALENGGVPFTVASEPTLSASDIASRSLDRSFIGGFSNELEKSHVKSGREAPMTVKLTALQDGAVLGVRCTHACLDGDSFYTMVRNWSRLCQKQSIPKPILDQTLLPQTTTRSKEEVLGRAADAEWTKLSLLKVARIIPAYLTGRLSLRAPAIRFGDEALNDLRARTAREIGVENLSTNVTISALLTKMSARLHQHRDETNCRQVTIVNLRGRISSLPAEFVGNASFPIAVTNFEAGTNLEELAEKIQRRLAPFLDPGSKAMEEEIELQLDLIRHRKLMTPFELSTMHSRKPTTVYINNFSKLPIYDVDFGDEGHPIRSMMVIPHDLPDPFLIWPAPPDKGGIEVYLQGVAARAVMTLEPGDPWWSEIRRCGGTCFKD